MRVYCKRIEFYIIMIVDDYKGFYKNILFWVIWYFVV